MTVLISTSQPLDEGTMVSSEERLSLTGSAHLRIEKRVQMPNTEFRSVETFVRQGGSRRRRGRDSFPLARQN